MRFARLAAVAAIAVATAACGSGSSSNGLASKSPEDIQSAMIDALKSAKSVHLKGDMTQDGERVEMDLQLTNTGEASGTITSEGNAISIIRVDGDFYMKADADAWEGLSGSADAAALLSGKWLKVPGGDEDFSDFEDLTDLSKLAGNMTAEGKLTKQPGTKTVNGKKAIVLEDESEDMGLLYVAATGTPYPLRVAPKAGSTDKGYLDFLDYGAPVTIKAPSDAVDLAKLISGLS
jgi:hypothetical protein